MRTDFEVFIIPELRSVFQVLVFSPFPAIITFLVIYIASLLQIVWVARILLLFLIRVFFFFCIITVDIDL